MGIVLLWKSSDKGKGLDKVELVPLTGIYVDVRDKLSSGC